jgi:tripartite-type tricarboxylate transporter receptor subunit TctC
VQLTAAPVLADDGAWREVKIVVGLGIGGGYDIYGRLVARHLGRFLPGSPRVIVVNMPGANGMTAAAYMAANARKDGGELFLGIQPLILSQLFKKLGVRFDGARYRCAKTSNLRRLGLRTVALPTMKYSRAEIKSDNQYGGLFDVRQFIKLVEWWRR